jgi:hypothetical protein
MNVWLESSSSINSNIASEKLIVLKAPDKVLTGIDVDPGLTIFAGSEVLREISKSVALNAIESESVSIFTLDKIDLICFVLITPSIE